ncbi:hypothetical protein BC940DRAFT_313849 [Gongronella butleri]|nr:hypothetical protein BC940DRAFT_313849 [Gongronella butleri]
MDRKGPLIFCCCLPRPGIMLLSFGFGCYSLFAILFSVLLGAFASPSEEPVPFYDWMLWRLLANLISSLTYFVCCYLMYKKRWQSFRILLYFMFFSLFMDSLYTCREIKDIFSEGIVKMDDHRQDLRDSFLNMTLSRQNRTGAPIAFNGQSFNGTNSFQGNITTLNSTSLAIVNGTMGCSNATANATKMAESMANVFALAIPVFFSVVVLVFNIIPLLTQVYLVNKIRAYLNYVAYKKDRKRLTE